jgi:dihydrodipicolinate synthase/N-acetylneuraminate lyase
MIELCALGDVHLDKLRKYWPNANTLQLNAYQRVISRQRSAGIEHFVICGDVADGIRDSTNNAMRLTEEGQCELLKFLMDVDGKANLHVILGECAPSSREAGCKLF